MKTSFPEIVENARLRNGSFRSSPGDPYGMFFLIHPVTQRKLKVMVGNGKGWDHVSVSMPRGRVPTWDDMCWVKHLFFKSDEWCVQYHPADGDYVNHTTNCLHIWRSQETVFPTPPKICV